MSDVSPAFRMNMAQLGVHNVVEVERVWSVAKQCAKTQGATTGAVTALALAGAGSVAVPGVGSIPAAAVGFLAGAASGTASCMMGNQIVREVVRQIAQGR